MTEQKEPSSVSVMLKLLGQCISHLLLVRARVDDALARVMLARLLGALAEQPNSPDSLRSFWVERSQLVEKDFQVIQGCLEQLQEGGLPDCLSLLEAGPTMEGPQAFLLRLIRTSQRAAIFELLLHGLKDVSDSLKRVDELVDIYTATAAQPISELMDWQGRLAVLSANTSVQLEVHRAFYDLGVKSAGAGKLR